MTTDSCIGCNGKNYNGDGEPPCFYCEPGVEDCDDNCSTCDYYGTNECCDDLTNLYKSTHSTIAGIIEDASDNGFAVMKDDHGLYIMNHCPSCHGNAMLKFRQVNTGRAVNRCWCGHKTWA